MVFTVSWLDLPSSINVQVSVWTVAPVDVLHRSFFREMHPTLSSRSVGHWWLRMHSYPEDCPCPKMPGGKVIPPGMAHHQQLTNLRLQTIDSFCLKDEQVCGTIHAPVLPVPSIRHQTCQPIFAWLLSLLCPIPSLPHSFFLKVRPPKNQSHKNPHLWLCF